MKQYSDLNYADSDRINYENAKNDQEHAEAIRQAEQQELILKEKLDNGIISQAEYDTLSVTTRKAAMENSDAAFAVPQQPLSQNDIIDQLTDEDYQYLNLK